MGDSFVKYFAKKDASFSVHFAAELGISIDSVSVSGGGPLQTRQALLRRRQNRLEEKRIVIWLFTVASFADADEWAELALK